MTIKQALTILKRHNKWRVGSKIPMEEPWKLTNAINVVTEYLTEQLKQK